MKKLLKEYQIPISIIFSGLIISATLYLIEFQRVEKIERHNKFAVKMCLDKKIYKYSRDQEKCLQSHAIKPFLLKKNFENVD
tara:strand:+ start:78 stop:323 length:246 start_codon:yes stop_codon:yes gene_type:complete